MRITFYQPQYWPRLHYFARALNSDVFVLSDSAQYTKKLVFQLPDGPKRSSSHQVHAPIKLAIGSHNLSVPVVNELSPISATQVGYQVDWVTTHLNSLSSAYGKAKYFPDFFPIVEKFLKTHPASLADLNCGTIDLAINYLLGIKTDWKSPTESITSENLKKADKFRLKLLMRDSDTGIKKPEGKNTANEWMVEICQKFGATEYFCGGTAHEAYMKPEVFEAAGVSISVQDWKCLPYTQRFTKEVGFLPNLSILDLLFNVGPEEAAAILQDD